MNKICPYCQSPIKGSSESIICEQCHAGHHKECWEENGGCTTFGCINNPLTVKPAEDVGQRTIYEIENIIENPPVSANLVNCPNCKKLIDENSTFCKFCGYNIPLSVLESKRKFEAEFQKRYKSKVSFIRRRQLITLGSIAVIIILLLITVYTALQHINKQISTDDYLIKSRIGEWEKAWESRDINKYSQFLDSNYIYISGGNKLNKEQRLKRIEWTFVNYRFIILELENFDIQSNDSLTYTATFRESYTSDKFKENGLKKTMWKKNSAGEWMLLKEEFN